jgi:hypothetical protein
MFVVVPSFSMITAEVPGKRVSRISLNRATGTMQPTVARTSACVAESHTTVTCRAQLVPIPVEGSMMWL